MRCGHAKTRAACAHVPKVPLWKSRKIQQWCAWVALFFDGCARPPRPHAVFTPQHRRANVPPCCCAVRCMQCAAAPHCGHSAALAAWRCTSAQGGPASLRQIPKCRDRQPHAPWLHCGAQRVDAASAALHRCARSGRAAAHPAGPQCLCICSRRRRQGSAGWEGLHSDFPAVPGCRRVFLSCVWRRTSLGRGRNIVRAPPVRVPLGFGVYQIRHTWRAMPRAGCKYLNPGIPPMPH